MGVSYEMQWGHPQFTLIPSKNFRNALAAKKATEVLCMLVYSRLTHPVKFQLLLAKKISYYRM